MEPGNVLARKRRLRALESALRALQGGPGAPGALPERRAASAVLTGWGRVDALLGVRGPMKECEPAPGLARGVLHEWCGAAAGPRARWTPPLILLAHLAGRALAAAEEPGSAGGAEPPRHVPWIGRAVWPYPVLLARPGAAAGAGEAGALVERSLCVDPPDAARRLWALALALRSPSVAAVVGDARGLDLTATRRLQLAAEAGGALALLARPPQEERRLSAAATRWRVRLVPTCGSAPRFPRWSVELLRVKGIQELRGAPSSGRGRMGGEELWGGIMEYDRAQGLVVEPSELADRSGPAPAEACGASVPRTA
jgi:hypothetical protein